MHVYDQKDQKMIQSVTSRRRSAHLLLLFLTTTTLTLSSPTPSNAQIRGATRIETRQIEETAITDPNIANPESEDISPGRTKKTRKDNRTRNDTEAFVPQPMPPTTNGSTVTENQATDPDQKPNPINEITDPNDFPTVETTKEGSCSTAKTCGECLENARVNYDSSRQEYACAWTNGVCSFTTQREQFLEGCDVGSTKATGGGEGGGIIQKAVGFLFFMGVLAGLFALKKRTFLGGAEKEDEIMSSSSSSDRFRNESVPLSTREDEWGWEDGDNDNGDLEMARRQEEDQLSMALALSISQNQNQSGEGLNSEYSSPSTGRSNTPRTAPDVDDSSWAESVPSPVPPPVVPKPKSTPPLSKKKTTRNATSPTISSFNKTPITKLNVTKKKKKTDDKPKEEDIFATMGLSAIPTFDKPKTVPLASKSSSSWSATATKNSSVASASDGLDDDSNDGNWEDDDDLDDLLDD